MSSTRNRIDWENLPEMNDSSFIKEYWTKRDVYRTKESVISKYICKNPGCSYMIRTVKDNKTNCVNYQSNTTLKHSCQENDELEFVKRAKIKLCVNDLTSANNSISPSKIKHQINTKLGLLVSKEKIYQEVALKRKKNLNLDNNGNLYVSDINC